jgi:PAS domain S-box-containing protein
VKIYDSQKKIIYSNDDKIIGKVDSKNKRLERALNGYVASHLTEKDRMLDLDNETKFNVKVLETYIPLKIADRVIGSIEIYTDVSKYRWQITRVVTLSTTFLAIILFSIFYASYRIIRRSTILLKKTQMELSERTILFQTLSDFATDWIFWHTPEGKTIYVSPACESITGYSPSEFMSDPGLEERLLHPEDQSRWKNYIRNLSHSFEQEDYRRIEIRLLARNGEYRWVSHVSKQIHDHSGSYLGVRGSNIDITEKKEAEKAIEEKVVALEVALANIKQLEGIIPICAYCKKIRDDKNAWQQMEAYICGHSAAHFSHGICPECYEKQILEIDKMHEEEMTQKKG